MRNYSGRNRRNNCNIFKEIKLIYTIFNNYCIKLLSFYNYYFDFVFNSVKIIGQQRPLLENFLSQEVGE